MSTRRSNQATHPQVPEEPGEGWELADGRDDRREPLHGGPRATSRLLAILITAIAIVAIAVAVVILVA
jgi:hypothetical protein